MTNFLHKACKGLKERVTHLGYGSKTADKATMDYLAGYTQALLDFSDHLKAVGDPISATIGEDCYKAAQHVGYGTIVISVRGYREVLHVCMDANEEEG